MMIDETSIHNLTQFAERVPLGRTGIQISPLGLGTWQFGDRFFWSYGRSHSDSDLQEAFQASLRAGINFFDTAEVYGLGYSERYLGRMVHALPESTRNSLVLASKFSPLPYRLGKSFFKRALRGSLRRLGMKQLDLYQIHWPINLRSGKTWAACLAEAHQAGLIRAAGVSNYTFEQTRKTWKILKGYGLPLASNQVAYNLIRRKVEKNGLLALCQELGITLIAYSPLAQGLLTGKYNPEHPPSGFRRGVYRQDLLLRIQPLIQQMKEIGVGHGGKSPAQVALNWAMCKGTVAIPGAKNKRQALENAGALGWKLTPEEMEALDQLSDEVAG
jgi:aryl-alcohol dehydrogenase-like predicted oxidoreductase